MEQKMYRQGDVLIIKIEQPKEKLEEKDSIIAFGEATGHSHIIKNAKVYRTSSGTQMIQVEKEAELVHPEHEAISLSEGWYEVRNQREYDPETMGRRVAD